MCLTVIDGSRNRLLARVAAHLTDTTVHFREGHVLRLNMFIDLIMKPHDQSPPTAVIVVVQMDIIGSGPILDDEANMLTPVIERLPNEGDDSIEWDSVDEEYEPPPCPEHPCTYGNHLCSVYGLTFRCCICEKSEKIPVADQDLKSIKRSCPFAAGDTADSLSPKLKRNMMYWWYVTNIFLICRKSCQGPLPKCLVYAIQCRYPNQKGVHYVGFLECDGETNSNKCTREE